MGHARALAARNPADDRLLDELCAVVDRGVEVQILVPGAYADKRFVQMSGEADDQRVLDEGIDLRTYERSMLHAEIVTVDGEIVTVGSANFNRRSMELGDECSLTLLSSCSGCDGPAVAPRCCHGPHDDVLREGVRPERIR